jgi:hypothetical protein
MVHQSAMRTCVGSWIWLRPLEYRQGRWECAAEGEVLHGWRTAQTHTHTRVSFNGDEQKHHRKYDRVAGEELHMQLVALLIIVEHDD